MRAAPWKRAANGRTPTEIYILGESRGNHLSFAPLVVRFFDFTRKGMARDSRNLIVRRGRRLKEREVFKFSSNFDQRFEISSFPEKTGCRILEIFPR